MVVAVLLVLLVVAALVLAVVLSPFVKAAAEDLAELEALEAIFSCSFNFILPQVRHYCFVILLTCLCHLLQL